MKYNIKKKIVDGKIVYGLIGENLKEVLPFECSNIEERSYDYHHRSWYGPSLNEKRYYYIFSDNENKKGIFINGRVVLEPIHDDADLISKGDSEWIKFIVGNKTEDGMEYGILQRKPEGKGEFKYEMVYPFGKADKIVVEDGIIMLYKTKGARVLKGTFNHPKLGTQDPHYTQLYVGESEPSAYPIMPDPSKYFVEKHTEWHFSNECDWNIPYAIVGKIKNKKEVVGILTRIRKYDKNTGEYHGEDIWNEFVPLEYNGCDIDTKNNLIRLSKIEKGKKLKGLMGFSTYWNISTEGSVVEGYCNFYPEFTIPCEYDDITLLHDASESYSREKEQYYIVKKDGKVGLIKVNFSIVRGPYDGSYKYRSNPKPKVEVLLECKYDSISRLKTGDFVLSNEGKKGLLINGTYDKEGKLLKTSCEYKNIEAIGSDRRRGLYIFTDFENKKSVFSTVYQQSGSEFNSTPFKYDSVSYDGLIKCSMSTENGIKYDVYDSSLGAIVSNADSVSLESGLHKITKKTDDGNTSILYVNNDGKVLFDKSGKDITASYCQTLRAFFINKNGILEVKYLDKEKDKTNFDIQGDYLTFDVLDSKQIRYRRKRESDDSKYGLYKFERNEWTGSIVVKPVLNDVYESVDVVLNETRSIVSKDINGDGQTIKFGVMENNEGNVCIPIDFDSMNLETDEEGNPIFVATNVLDGVPKKFVFDTDGFALDDPSFIGGAKSLGTNV